MPGNGAAPSRGSCGIGSSPRPPSTTRNLQPPTDKLRSPVSEAGIDCERRDMKYNSCPANHCKRAPKRKEQPAPAGSVPSATSTLTLNPTTNVLHRCQIHGPVCGPSLPPLPSGEIGAAGARGVPAPPDGGGEHRTAELPRIE